MIHHTRAVARGSSTHGSSRDPIVIAELPMGTYEVSGEQGAPPLRARRPR